MSDLTTLKIKKPTLKRLSRFELTLEENISHSQAVDLLLDTKDEVMNLVDYCDGNDGACQELYSKLVDLLSKFER